MSVSYLHVEITRLLNQAQQGDKEATDEVLAMLYEELRKIARAQLGGAPQTLQPTALVNEAYLRLMRKDQSWESRTHFFCFAARAMRSVLVDYERKRRRLKRGGTDRKREPLHDAAAWFEENHVDLLALHEALERLETEDTRKHQLVELRFFAGLENAAIADVQGTSLATVERDWTAARAWLYRYMNHDS